MPSVSGKSHRDTQSLQFLRLTNSVRDWLQDSVRLLRRVGNASGVSPCFPPTLKHGTHDRQNTIELGTGCPRGQVQLGCLAASEFLRSRLPKAGRRSSRLSTSSYGRRCQPFFSPLHASSESYRPTRRQWEPPALTPCRVVGPRQGERRPVAYPQSLLASSRRCLACRTNRDTAGYGTTPAISAFVFENPALLTAWKHRRPEATYLHIEDRVACDISGSALSTERLVSFSAFRVIPTRVSR